MRQRRCLTEGPMQGHQGDLELIVAGFFGCDPLQPEAGANDQLRHRMISLSAGQFQQFEGKSGDEGQHRKMCEESFQQALGVTEN
ncbi:uncharacterized protein METZ01_LOCUS388937, partial [marine metagenome]